VNTLIFSPMGIVIFASSRETEVRLDLSYAYPISNRLGWNDSPNEKKRDDSCMQV